MKSLKNKKYVKGFTLIEVMMVVAIVGVISAIAIPSYTEYVQKAKRIDGKEFLIRLAQLQESYFVQNLSYAKDLTVDPGGLGFGSAVKSDHEEYSITMTTKDNGGGACTGFSADSCSSYVLTATAVGSQAADKCKNFTLTNTGVKGLSGFTGTPTTAQIKSCW